MAIIIEDGSVVAAANSYVTADEAQLYHQLRQNSEWTDSDAPTKEAALVLAAQYLNGMRWKGCRSNMRQALAWPRLDVPAYDDDGVHFVGGHVSIEYLRSLYWGVNEIPQRLKDAQCEVALAIVKGTDMMPTLDRGGMVRVEKIGPITTEYMPGAPSVPRLPAVEALLRGMTKPGGLVEVGRG